MALFALLAAFVAWIYLAGSAGKAGDDQSLVPSGSQESAAFGEASNLVASSASQESSVAVQRSEWSAGKAGVAAPLDADPGPGSVFGHVRVEAGSWPADFEITIRWEALPGEPRGARTRVAEDGSFGFEEVPPGRIWLEGFMPQNALFKLGPLLVEPGQRLVGIELWYGGRSIEGFVVDEDGQPVEGAHVRTDAQRWVGNRSSRINLKTDANGYFREEHALLGRGAWICADQRDAEHVLTKTSLPQSLLADAGQIRLTLLPTVSLKGRVVDAYGEPVEGATVKCTWLQSKRDSSCKTDVLGRYEFRGIYPEELRLTAFIDAHEFGAQSLDPKLSSHVPSLSLHLNPAPGERLNCPDLALRAPNASIACRVLPASQAEAAANDFISFALVLVPRPTGKERPEEWIDFQVQSQRRYIQCDGTFSTFEALGAGFYSLYVNEFYGHYSAQSYVSKHVFFELLPGQHLEISITPEPLQKVTLRGRVRVDGEAQLGSMRWTAKDYAEVSVAPLTDGRFVTTLPRPGTYHIVQQLTQGTASGELLVEETPPDWLELTLTRD